MSDPRFARLKTDPRFRKPRRKSNKVVVDDRFKSIFENGTKKTKTKGNRTKVDKYGRKLSESHDSDNLKRFYRLEDQAEEPKDESATPDYARGEILMESSDEENQHVHDSESDNGEVVLGRDVRKPITIPHDEPEIDFDESRFAELDALAAANAANAEGDGDASSQEDGEKSNRLAVVNLDWDHVRASHLFKIFSSVVSPPTSSRRGQERGGSSKGRVLLVRVYPSGFGKERLAQEQKEGPPKELFKKRGLHDAKGSDLVEEDDGNEYDEEALRRYQLERLRYYYAIVTCDTVDTANHIYSELDGTELERSANTFDLSFVPNDMKFDEEFRDEATQDISESYKGIEFVTDALRHSKVKLTWDDDDPERNKVTRRTLSRKEIEESDFKAYLASSGSSDEGSDTEAPFVGKRDQIRALLLGRDDEYNELLPEGWGQDVDKAGEMEITFTPGLSGKRDDSGDEEETTLQRYLRKQKEKRKKKKTDKSEKHGKGQDEETAHGNDEFFGEDSDDQEEAPGSPPKHKTKVKGKLEASKHVETTPAELQLLLTSNTPSQGPKHFDMRSVVKAEKVGLKKRSKKDKRKDKGTGPDEDETQEDFAINVKDDRFKALHEDHTFAIDPTNPHFKKTKSMAALLDERAKRQSNGTERSEHEGGQRKDLDSGRSLESLVESVKRKSTITDHRSGGKRRKL